MDETGQRRRWISQILASLAGRLADIDKLTDAERSDAIGFTQGVLLDLAGELENQTRALSSEFGDELALMMHGADAEEFACDNTDFYSVQKMLAKAGQSLIVRGDRLPLKGLVAFCEKWRRQTARPVSGLASDVPKMTRETFESYLQSVWPGVLVTGFDILSNGYSKKTWLARLTGNGFHPAEVVIRQDTAHMEGASVIEEYATLAAIADYDLPVPRCVHLEPHNSSLGPPFLLMPRLPGKSFGNMFGLQAVEPSVAISIAQILAGLHSIDISRLDLAGARADLGPEDRMLRQIEIYENRWSHATIEPSALIDTAYGVLRRVCREGVGPSTLVHGDLSSWNFLEENGRATALLDWEYAHIGDPAEDLAYCRETVEQIIPWNDFLAAYYAAGGPPVDDRRLKIFAVWGPLRNAALAAGVARKFTNDPSLGYRLGAIGYLSISAMEMAVTSPLKALIDCI